MDKYQLIGVTIFVASTYILFTPFATIRHHMTVLQANIRYRKVRSQQSRRAMNERGYIPDVEKPELDAPVDPSFNTAQKMGWGILIGIALCVQMVNEVQL